MKYTINVDDKSKAGSILVELAKIFSKLYKSITINSSDASLIDPKSKKILDEIEEGLRDVKKRQDGKGQKTKTLKQIVDGK